MLYEQIKYLYPTAGNGDFIIQDDSDGTGPRIVRWNVEKLGAAPDASDIIAKISKDKKFLAFIEKKKEIDAEYELEKNKGALIRSDKIKDIRAMAFDDTKKVEDIIAYNPKGLQVKR